MQQVFQDSAGFIGFITTAFFAGCLWIYATLGYGFSARYLIIIGIASIALIALSLWASVVADKISQKKGRRSNK